MQDILKLTTIIKNIVTAFALLFGGIWSWYQFSIGDILKPNFILNVDLVNVLRVNATKLAIVRITIKNIGKVKIKHYYSELEVYPILASDLSANDLEEDVLTPQKMNFVKRKHSTTISNPFSSVYIILKRNDGVVESEKRPFILRPDEEISVDIPILIKQPATVALGLIASFHCTKKEFVRSDKLLPPVKRINYGVRFQKIFPIQLETELSKDAKITSDAHSMQPNPASS